MYAGQSYSGEFYSADECLQVSDWTYLDDAGDAYLDQQQIWIGERVDVRDDSEHWLNAVGLGQQSDGIKFRAGKYTDLMPGSFAKTVATPFAKFGARVLEISTSIATGGYAFQEIPAALVPSYYKFCMSFYVKKRSSGDGTVVIKWGYDYDEVTVASATRDLITVDDRNWGIDELVGKYIYIRDGVGKWQWVEIDSNTAAGIVPSRSLGTPPEDGDTISIIDLAAPTIKRIDEQAGLATDTTTVVGGADWHRFRIVFKPPSTYNYLYGFIQAYSDTDGTNVWFDGAKLEPAPILAAGYVTAVGADQFTDSGKSWTADDYYYQEAIFVTGDSSGTYGTITANTTDTVSCIFRGKEPVVGDTYIIVPSDDNCYPTAFTDITPYSLQAARVAAYNIEAGDLVVGGPLAADYGRLLVMDSQYDAIIRMGERVDDTDPFCGMQLLKGTGIALQGGAIVAKPDKGHTDDGRRVRIDYLGFEGWNADGILKTYVRSDAIGLVLGTSPLQHRVELNDLGITAIDRQGRVFFNVNPDVGSMIVGVYGGNYISFDGNDVIIRADDVLLGGDDFLIDTANKYILLGGAILSYSSGSVQLTQAPGQDASLTLNDDLFLNWPAGIRQIEEDGETGWAIVDRDHNIRGYTYEVGIGESVLTVIGNDLKLDVKYIRVRDDGVGSPTYPGAIWADDWIWSETELRADDRIRLNDLSIRSPSGGEGVDYRIFTGTPTPDYVLEVDLKDEGEDATITTYTTFQIPMWKKV